MKSSVASATISWQRSVIFTSTLLVEKVVLWCDTVSMRGSSPMLSGCFTYNYNYNYNHNNYTYNYNKHKFNNYNYNYNYNIYVCINK